MFVKHLMEYLEKFVDDKKGNAIQNAQVYIQKNDTMHQINRIEVLENNIIGQPSIFVLLRTEEDGKKLPDKFVKGVL
jgi:hypothetical protein